MPFDIDTPTGGGESGPFIQWQAKESTDGNIPGRSWVLRDSLGVKSVVKFFDAGVVMDFENLKTGWCYSTGTAGTAPQWKWNANPRKFDPQPAEINGITWKRGISLPLAFGPKPTDRAVWEQAQAGAWSAFAALVAVLKASNPPAGKYPVIKQDGVEKIESKRGITFAPKLGLLKWVDCPPALQGALAAVDTGDDDVPF